MFFSSNHFSNNFCISKYQQRYNDVTKMGDLLSVTCLICNRTFYKTSSLTATKEHYDKCKELQTFANMQPRIQPKTIATTSNTNGVITQMPSSSTNSNPNPNRFVLGARNQNVGINPTQATTTTTPKVSQIKELTLNLDKYLYDLRTVKRVADNKIIQCAECRICKMFFGMDLILSHR